MAAFIASHQGACLVALIISGFSFDQATKQIMLDWIFEPPRRVVVTSFFNFTPVWNYGISFGMFQADGWGRWVLVILPLLIAGGLGVWLANVVRGEASGGAMLKIALACIIAGAVGNVTDRVIYGAVVDFLDFHAFGHHWPAFNIADALISVSVGLLLIDHFTSAKKESKTKE